MSSTTAIDANVAGAFVMPAVDGGAYIIPLSVVEAGRVPEALRPELKDLIEQGDVSGFSGGVVLPLMRDVEDGRGGRWMALLSTAVTLVLFLGAGVWWVAAGRGGEDGAAGGAVTAAGGAVARAAGTGEDAGVGVVPAAVAGERSFYFLLVDSPAQAVAVREQWDASNRRRVLHGLPELDGSVFSVEPGDDVEWLYRNVAYAEEGALRRGRSGVEVLDLRGGDDAFAL